LTEPEVEITALCGVRHVARVKEGLGGGRKGEESETEYVSILSAPKKRCGTLSTLTKQPASIDTHL